MNSAESVFQTLSMPGAKCASPIPISSETPFVATVGWQAACGHYWMLLTAPVRATPMTARVNHGLTCAVFHDMLDSVGTRNAIILPMTGMTGLERISGLE